MRLWLRIALYLGGGGLLLSWIDPPAGLATFALVCVLIVVAAYLDPWVFRAGPGLSGPGGRNVVTLQSLRQARQRRGGAEATGGGHGRRALRTVYSSGIQGDVDELLRLLRGEGLNPVMVSEAAAREGAGFRYEVRLPEKEVPRAKPLIQFFLLQSSKQPS